MKLAIENRPDLIILDVLMPGMDGPGLADSFKELSETRDVPILFLTGMFPKHEDKQQGRLVGDNLLFDKPPDTEVLLETISRLLSDNMAALFSGEINESETNIDRR